MAETEADRIDSLRRLCLRMSRVLLSAVLLCLLAGCSPKKAVDKTAVAPAVAVSLCAGVDESSLEQVATCFAARNTNAGTYAFLAKTSQEQISELEWNAEGIHRSQRKLKLKAVKVLGTETLQGSTFARVSVTMEIPDTRQPTIVCSQTFTYSLRQEEGRWRLLAFPKLDELMAKVSNSGDVQAVVDAATKYLQLDPFNIDSYKFMASAAARGAKAPKTKEDIVRAVLGINPIDSSALFLATTYTKDLAVKRTFLNRMERDDSARGSALFNLAIRVPIRERLGLLDEQAPSCPETSLMLIRIDALSQTARNPEARALLTEERLVELRSYLQEQGPTHAAEWATTIGAVLFKSGSVELARDWVSYALERDPESKATIQLLKKLPKK